MDAGHGFSPFSLSLYFAVQKGYTSLAKNLLNAGANVNQEIEVPDPDDDEVGEHYITFTPIILAVVEDHLEMVKLLLEYNPNVNDQDANGGRLPLVLAAQNGKLEIVKTLLAHPGIVVNARDSRGYLALGVASENGDYDMFNLLMKYGEHSREDYSEALGMAAHTGRAGIIRFLLEHGADPNYMTATRAYPPLYSLLWGRDLETIQLLLHYGAKPEVAFKCMIRLNQGPFYHALKWLSEDTTRTIIGIKRLVQQPTTQDLPFAVETVLRHWNGVASSLWFHYFGPFYRNGPPAIEDTLQFSDEEFKMAYKWMIHAVSSLLHLEEGSILLTHLFRFLDPCVALESCEHTGKTPLLVALEKFRRQNETEQQDAVRGTNLLIEWNPDALKVPHPCQRMPMTCAIHSRAPLATLQKMITCKKEYTNLPLQLDPYTLLPNFLLVAAGKDCYSAADIYAFSRKYLPHMISSLQSTTGVRRRGIKRSLEQI